MNTLSKSITTSIYARPDHYEALRAQWSRMVNDKSVTLTAAHHLLYLALLGKDWRKAFTPPTNTRRLGNGGFHQWALWQALNGVQFSGQNAYPHVVERAEAFIAPFGGVVTLAMLEAVSSRIPSPCSYDRERYAAAYVPGVFPFDAYGEALLHAAAG